MILQPAASEDMLLAFGGQWLWVKVEPSNAQGCSVAKDGLLLRSHCQQWRHTFMSSDCPPDPRALLRGLSLCEALSCLGILG